MEQIIFYLLINDGNLQKIVSVQRSDSLEQGLVDWITEIRDKPDPFL